MSQQHLVATGGTAAESFDRNTSERWEKYRRPLEQTVMMKLASSSCLLSHDIWPSLHISRCSHRSNTTWTGISQTHPITFYLSVYFIVKYFFYHFMFHPAVVWFFTVSPHSCRSPAGSRRSSGWRWCVWDSLCWSNRWRLWGVATAALCSTLHFDWMTHCSLRPAGCRCFLLDGTSSCVTDLK